MTNTSDTPVSDERLDQLVNSFDETWTPQNRDMKAALCELRLLRERHREAVELLEVAKCPNCTGEGFTVEGDRYGQPVQVQCQFCFEREAFLATEQTKGKP